MTQTEDGRDKETRKRQMELKKKRETMIRKKQN